MEGYRPLMTRSRGDKTNPRLLCQYFLLVCVFLSPTNKQFPTAVDDGTRHRFPDNQRPGVHLLHGVYGRVPLVSRYS